MEGVKEYHAIYGSEIVENRDIQDAISGNKEAYINIIEENKAYLYKIAYMYVKDEDRALEIVQETIIRGYINIKKLKDKLFFKTWLTRILINVAIDMMKKESKNREINNLDNLDNYREVSIEAKLDLYNAVDLLSDKYKTIVILKYFNDMKIQDIAILMEIPENTVKSSLNRAKKKLREILKEGYMNE